MDIDAKGTALVITDPQNVFPSPSGVTWGRVRESVQENRTATYIDNRFHYE